MPAGTVSGALRDFSNISNQIPHHLLIDKLETHLVMIKI